MEEDPSISIGPLKIWILSRQFPEHQDYWDGNWLNVTALCEGNGSRVKVSGSFIHLGELKQWKEALVEFQHKLVGSINLPTMEPTLGIKITTTNSGTGQLDCEIDITGNHISEQHHFVLNIDQSYLSVLLTQLAIVLREYPIRDTQ